jgi:glucose-6-phosphate isomerase
MKVLPLGLSFFLLLNSSSATVIAPDSPATTGTATCRHNHDLKPNTMHRSWTLKCTDVPQSDALQAAADSFRTDDKLHLRSLCNDSARCAGLMAVHQSEGGRKVILDYSRQQVTGETMDLLFDLADAVGFTERRAEMQSGVRINSSEDRAVLHHVLRMPKNYDYDQNPDGAKILGDVHAVRSRIADFSEKVRTGEYTGVTGKVLKNVISIGIGGSSLGPEFVMEALRADSRGLQTSEGRILRFLANVDPVDFHVTTQDLDPEETLVIVVSKTFTTAETMLNARTMRKWLVHSLRGDGIGDADIVAKHMVAVSTNIQACREFGILEPRVFGIWDWVGGRFSVTSAVGLVPLSLHYSYAVMEDFLNGAHNVDEHFFKSPLRDNIPVLLGLLGVWNSTFLGYGVRALLPYSQALKRFPAHIQQVDMESNGKRVALDGTPLMHPSGEINFGEPGTNGQHSFYQLMHQGRVVPADFIGFMESQQPVDMSGEPVSNHDELMSNFFAQPDALAYGKTMADLVQEGVPEELRAHMVFSGNRPSSSILMTKLDAFAVGQLLALYEHRTAVQGFIWGINSFDQWGVELGKVLAMQVRAQLTASRTTFASVQGFNSSTSSLLEAYLAHGK